MISKVLLPLAVCLFALTFIVSKVEGRQDSTWDASERTSSGRTDTRMMLGLEQFQPRDDQDALRQVAFDVLKNYVQCNMNAGNLLRLAFHGKSCSYCLVSSILPSFQDLKGMDSSVSWSQ